MMINTQTPDQVLDTMCILTTSIHFYDINANLSKDLVYPHVHISEVWAKNTLKEYLKMSKSRHLLRGDTS